MADNQEIQPQDQAQENTPNVALKKAPAEDKAKKWIQIQGIFNAAHKAYVLSSSSLQDVLDSLIATLMDFKASETQKLGGLGQNAQMDLPAQPEQTNDNGDQTLTI